MNANSTCSARHNVYTLNQGLSSTSCTEFIRLQISRRDKTSRESTRVHHLLQLRSITCVALFVRVRQFNLVLAEKPVTLCDWEGNRRPGEKTTAAYTYHTPV